MLTPLHFLTVLALTNLFCEQSICRQPINRWFDSPNYRNFTHIKRFFYDLISCPSCLGFHLGWIYHLAFTGLILPSLQFGLIVMFLYAVLEKLKR